MTKLALHRAPDAESSPGGAGFDVATVRQDFPALHQSVHGKPLVYLDSAASAQKPRQVLDAMQRFYQHDYANVHRGVHLLSARATDQFEEARETVCRFINAASADEIVFTRGATESINLVAASWGGTFLNPGDEVVLSQMEHHANIVPWQLLRDHRGIVLKVVPIDDAGSLDMDAYEGLLGERTRLVALSHMSNVLGTINPAADIVRLAHARGIPVLLDGCQAITHFGVDVQALDVDFYVFSGHKLYGPTGIGVLYGKNAELVRMPPYQGGGDMIASVSFEKTTYKAPPSRFEAGTPAIAEAIGLAAAINYITGLGRDNIVAHERDLLAYGTQRITTVPGLHLVGTAPHKAGILSFTMDAAHPHDIGTIIDRAGVAVRTGHHCAQPLMDRYNIAATCRASLGLYNNRADIDALVSALTTVQEIFG